MTKRRLLVGFALAIAVAGVAVWFFVTRLMHHAPGVPAGMVPVSWAEFKKSPGHRTHVGRDDVACKDCHDFDKEGFKNAGAATCTKSCHAKQRERSHLGGEGAKTDCLSCHAFAPDVAPRPCIGCHDAKTVGAKGTHAAVVAHKTVDCASCS